MVLLGQLNPFQFALTKHEFLSQSLQLSSVMVSHRVDLHHTFRTDLLNFLGKHIHELISFDRLTVTDRCSVLPNHHTHSTDTAWQFGL